MPRQVCQTEVAGGREYVDTKGLASAQVAPPRAAVRAVAACRGQRTDGPLVLRPVSGKPIERRDCYRMVQRMAKAAGIPRQVSPHGATHAITNALDAGVPPSVAAMAAVMVVRADPHASVPTLALLSVATAAFWAVAWPAFHGLVRR